jgi:hypothetical protein
LLVRFHDGEEREATLFAQNVRSKHVVLKVTSHLHRPCVHFTAYNVRRKNIFTMAALEADGGIGLMSGTIRYIYVFHLNIAQFFLGFSSC